MVKGKGKEIRVLRAVVYMVKSRVPRAEIRETPQEQVCKEEKIKRLISPEKHKQTIWKKHNTCSRSIHENDLGSPILSEDELITENELLE